MENTDSVLDTISTISLFLLAISFVVSLFAIESNWNEFISERMNKKASSYYTQAYIDSDNLATASEVFTDIMSEEETVNIQINGNIISTQLLEKARNNDTSAIRAIKNALSGTYKKKLYYNKDATIETINYIAE